MNAKTITTWIAQHRVRAALIALGVVVLAWDWFAIPRIIIMMILPLFLLFLPLILIGGPIVVLIVVLRKRAQARAVAQQNMAQGFQPNNHPGPQPQQAPQRQPTQQEIMDMYDRYPERFEGMDLPDDIDR